ncbi:MAG: hypothetical protein ACRDPJ_20665 [Nocardioidaceae bacterium]
MLDDRTCDDSPMDTPGRATNERPDLQQTVLVVSGLIVAFVGLALYAMAERRIDRFLSSAMVFTGALMVIPQLVARAVQAQHKP